MSENLAASISGLLFGLGLCLSGMADPSVVLGFLDLAGAWNPALLFVKASGVTVAFIGYRIVFGFPRPVCAQKFSLPAATAINVPLLGGAAVFGVGWGLAGYCPGPALVSLASGKSEVFVFAIAMLAGTIAVRWWRARPVSAAPAAGRA